MACPQVEVILADQNVSPALAEALHRCPASAAFRPLCTAAGRHRPTNVDALVVVLPEQVGPMSAQLRKLFDEFARQPCPTLVVTPTGHAAGTVERAGSGTITCLRADDRQGLAAHLQAALAAGRALRTVREQAAADRQAARRALDRHAAEVRAAGNMQRSTLPATLPRCGPLAFTALVRPAHEICSDVHDVHELDEKHVGIALADVGGHDISAALLTMCVQTALRAAHARVPTPPCPAAILQTLNADLIAAAWHEGPIVAAAYAVINTQTLEVSLARGGAPYPLYRRRNGELEALPTAGGSLGVSPTVRFEVTRFTMEPGDALLLYSDGLERLVCPPDAGAHVEQAIKRAADRIAGWNIAAARAVAPRPTVAIGEPETAGGRATSVLTTSAPHDCPSLPSGPPVTPEAGPAPICVSPWAETLRTRGLDAALNTIADRQRLLRRIGYPLDDLTLLAVQVEA